jgi:peptidoglycan/LPS O-acetylase OafA/YrhL
MTATPTLVDARRDIAGLDGLRAVSIACVLVSHLLLTSHAPTWLVPIRQLGLLGVHVFFVISGFLITMLLVRESDRTGRISLRGFVWRRVTRILPAYAVYLLVTWILVRAPSNVRWWPALTYSSNVFTTNWWLTGHTWSLSVEEQFYLTWPAILWLLGPKRAGWIALGVFVSGPIGRSICYLITHDGWLTLSAYSHDFIAAGALLALWKPNGVRLRAGWIFPLTAVALCAGFAGAMRWAFLAQLAIALPLEALAITFTLAWCLAEPRGTFVRALECRPIKWLGLISYSAYLWQQLFMWEHSPLPVAAGIPATLLVAGVSYYLVEVPGLALRKVLPDLLRARWAPLAGTE